MRLVVQSALLLALFILGPLSVMYGSRALSALATPPAQLGLPFTVFGQVYDELGKKVPATVKIKGSLGPSEAHVNETGFYYFTINARVGLDWLIVEADNTTHLGYNSSVISTKLSSNIQLDVTMKPKKKIVTVTQTLTITSTENSTTTRTYTSTTTFWMNATSTTVYIYVKSTSTVTEYTGTTTTQVTTSSITEYSTTTAIFTIVSPTETTTTLP